MSKKIEEEKKERFKDTYIRNVFFLTIVFFLIEIIFRLISNFTIFNYAVLRILLSDFILALIVAFLSSLTKRRWLRNTINLLFIFLYSLYTWLQLGFINYLGVYISFHTSSQFGAVKDYIFDYLNSFKLLYYIIFVPFILSVVIYIIWGKKRSYEKLKFNKSILGIFLTLIISCVLYYSTLVIPFMQNSFQIKSNKSLFHNPDVPTVAVNQFGTVMFGVVDLKSFLIPTEGEDTNVFEAKTPSGKVDVKRQVSSALEEIAKNETDPKYTSLNNYFASQSVTDYNEYTGMFEGKNVIVVLMESVNEAIINEKYYPNFTKLYNEGWHWENNYSPRNSCATGNNEFSAMTGLYSIYNTCTSNVYKNNTYFEAIFNLFNNKGYETTSMHDFVEWYYKRKTIHPNMGSGKFYGADALDIKTASFYGEWPSDEEFVEKAMDIVLEDTSKPFMTWLTTVTSHQPYTNNSTYGELYKDYFKSEGYSTTVSRYLSKLKVVDNAIGIMVDRLKEAGVFDDTVIVLLADHYPYALNKNQVGEMLSYSLDDYDIEKTPLLIYNSSMTPTTYKEYNSYINLLPTLANLMNLDYDPRLYAGSDVLSKDYVSRVVFADGSWKNEKAYYNASTSKVTYYEENAYTPEEIQEINSLVDLKISMSSKAIKSNYFDYLGKKIDEYNNAHAESEEEVKEELEENSEN